MDFLTELLDLLPPPYAIAEQSVLGQVLNVFALEMEVYQEDIEAMRQTHWVEFANRLEDLEKLAQLVGIERLPWEDATLFRTRLLSVVTARLRGALGPNEIREFVVEYLTRAEAAFSQRYRKASKTIFVPGLSNKQVKDPFQPLKEMPHYRPLALVENPTKLRRSNQLLAINGRVPYLYRWEEQNRGLDETVATFEITGFADARTAAPVIVNLTTRELIGYRGTLGLGQSLSIELAKDAGVTRKAVATINDQDVTASLYSVSNFSLGSAFDKDDLDASTQLPRMARGVNQWIFLSVGFFDLKGLNHFFFAIADEQLREASFNETFFNHALFPGGPVAKLFMRWEETEPASFEVRVPWYVVVEHHDQIDTQLGRPHEMVAEGLRVTLRQLHAAGVRAEVRFDAFVEVQPQKAHLQSSWKVLEPEKGPAGQSSRITLGGHFGETGFEDSRFE